MARPPAPSQTSTGWVRPSLRAIRGLLALVWAFAPELATLVLGAIAGLVLGVLVGAGLTAGALSSGGAWGHAGPIALILPLFTFVGPVLLCVGLGACLPPLVVLAVHTLVILARKRDICALPDLVVLTTAAGVLVPAVALGCWSQDFAVGVVVGLLFAPVTGLLGMLAGASYAGARSILAGRSLRQWWIDADGTMGVAMLTLSIGSWLAVWIPLMILFAFPGVLVALPAAIALGARLAHVGNRRGVVIPVLTLNVLHAALLVWAWAQT